MEENELENKSSLIHAQWKKLTQKVNEDLLKQVPLKLEKIPSYLHQELRENYKYTQTEAYLKVALQELYKEGNYNENVKNFFEKYPFLPKAFPSFLSQENLVEIIKNEKKHPNHFVFYNALRTSQNFSYDVIDRIRQIICMLGNPVKTRISPRISDVLFLEYLDENKTITMEKFIEQEKIKEHPTPDTNKSYQRKVASTNIFLFGNSQKLDENTLNYVHSSFQEMSNGEKEISFDKDILEFTFKELGFSEKFIDIRVKEYEKVFRKYESFWRRATLQQIFLTLGAVNDDAYLSGPFGKILTIDGDNKPLASLLKKLRNDPTIEYNFLDSLQARLLWNPQHLQNGEMIIEVLDLFDLSDCKNFGDQERKEKNQELEKELLIAKNELNNLIMEDIKEWLNLPDSASYIFSLNPQRDTLLRLRDTAIGLKGPVTLK